MKKILCVALACALAVGVATASAAPDELTATTAFERIKSLAGTWTGAPEGVGAEAAAEAEAVEEAVFEIELSAGGTVVMETMGPGTPHEMINMYHLDGDDLVLTHYCAGGNQPRMRLDRAASSADRLVFAYDGGTNHDPAVDQHIHSAEIVLLGANRLDSNWTAHNQGEPAGQMLFHLERSE